MANNQHFSPAKGGSRQGPLPGEQTPTPGPLYDRPLPPWLVRAFTRFPFLRRYPHPMLIHFPIVFLLSASCFSLLYLLTGDPTFEDTAFYCLAGGVLFLPPTILTGLFTHWLNFPGEADKTIQIEKGLSYSLFAVAAVAFAWRWLNPRVLADPRGINLLYVFLILAVTPLVTATSYFGGMLTFPLEEPQRSGISTPVKHS